MKPWRGNIYTPGGRNIYPWRRQYIPLEGEIYTPGGGNIYPWRRKYISLEGEIYTPGDIPQEKEKLPQKNNSHWFESNFRFKIRCHEIGLGLRWKKLIQISGFISFFIHSRSFYKLINIDKQTCWVSIAQDVVTPNQILS